jgi:hypothetical protein
MNLKNIIAGSIAISTGISKADAKQYSTLYSIMTNKVLDYKEELSKESQPGLYESAVSGFAAPSSIKIKSKVQDNPIEENIKKKFGLDDEDKLWPQEFNKMSGEFRSYLVPLKEAPRTLQDRSDSAMTR